MVEGARESSSTRVIDWITTDVVLSDTSSGISRRRHSRTMSSGGTWPFVITKAATGSAQIDSIRSRRTLPGIVSR